MGVDEVENRRSGIIPYVLRPPINITDTPAGSLNRNDHYKYSTVSLQK